MNTTSGSKTINYYTDKGLDDLEYWFGSDNFGRDIWTRTWAGARVSLIIAVAAAVIDMVIGMSYGLISGYFGGRVDMVMQRILEIANGIPRLVIVTLLGDTAQYYRPDYYPGNVFHSYGYFHGGLLKLRGAWHPGTSVLLRLSDLGRV